MGTRSARLLRRLADRRTYDRVDVALGVADRKVRRMANYLTIPVLVQAVELSVRCTRLISLDVIWTGQAGRTESDLYSPKDLAALADEMASEIRSLQQDMRFAKRFSVNVGSDIDATPMRVVRAMEPLIVSVVSYIEENSSTVADDLHRRAEVLRRGGTPEGDLPRRFWASLTTLAGFLLVVGGAASEGSPASEEMPIMNAADSLGGALLGIGLSVLSEKRPEE